MAIFVHLNTKQLIRFTCQNKINVSQKTLLIIKYGSCFNNKYCWLYLKVTDMGFLEHVRKRNVPKIHTSLLNFIQTQAMNVISVNQNVAKLDTFLTITVQLKRIRNVVAIIIQAMTI